MHESDRAFLLGLFRNTGLDEVEAEKALSPDEYGGPPSFLKVLKKAENTDPSDFAKAFTREHPSAAVSVKRLTEWFGLAMTNAQIPERYNDE